MDRATVINTSELPLERWDDPRRGTVAWRTIFSGDRTPTSALTVGLAEFAPQGDGTIGNATHRHEPPEIYYIVEGDGVVVIDGQPHEVCAGNAVFIPGGAEHSLVNRGRTPLRLLYVFAADSFEDIAYVFRA